MDKPHLWSLLLEWWLVFFPLVGFLNSYIYNKQRETQNSVSLSHETGLISE